jgi:coatomer subunit epsilon
LINFASLSLLVDIMLRMNRVDLALFYVDKMKELSEDSVSTQLAEAWLAIYSSGSKYQDAFYIFQELMETFGPTSKLINGQAVSYMSMQKFADAESLLMDALKRSPEDPDILANLITCLRHLGRAEKLSLATETLKKAAPKHPVWSELSSKVSLFDDLNQKFAGH